MASTSLRQNTLGRSKIARKLWRQKNDLCAEFAQKKGLAEANPEKSLGEDAYRAIVFWLSFIFCASANSAIAVANDATIIYTFKLKVATFERSRDQAIFAAVRQN